MKERHSLRAPLGLALLGSLLLGAGCGESSAPRIVVYAAQDRVFAEPVLRAFEHVSGVQVRALYDSEATKTVGLANRLVAESARPQADLWWSNEEMRTRQLAARGVVERGWRTFGGRQRVWVVRTNSALLTGPPPTLGMMTHGEWRGRVALAYPVFGSTTTHLLALRQRWGEVPWQRWCTALAANRPWVVDGNSVVVRLVARGDADLGLTDSDDVAFGRREGLGVTAIPMAAGEGLTLPNTVAVVAGRSGGAGVLDLMAFLSGDPVRSRLAAAGAIDPVEGGVGGKEGGLTEPEWDRLLSEFDGSLEWLKETFIR